MDLNYEQKQWLQDEIATTTAFMEEGLIDDTETKEYKHTEYNVPVTRDMTDNEYDDLETYVKGLSLMQDQDDLGCTTQDTIDAMDGKKCLDKYIAKILGQ